MTLVTTEIHDRVAIVTLDDADRRNAISPSMVDEIVATFDRIEADPEVSAVVVTGTPPAFCAGADLSGFTEEVRPGLKTIYEGFLRISRSPLPTVAAVNGPAIGAGVNLALVCDLRIAARSARFESRFLDLGLHPGGGHTWMLRRVCGPQTTAAMVLFGEPLDGEEAARRGLAWRCVDDDVLLDEATTLAGRAAQVPPELARRAKASLRAMTRIHEHLVAVEIELEHQAWSVQQPEFAERLAALKKKIKRSGS
jgi:enoyl-CoA hydratase